MTNNPLDELVQTSSDPAAGKPGLAAVGNPSTSSVPSSVAPDMPSQSAAVPSSTPPTTQNPLDELISGTTSTPVPTNVPSDETSSLPSPLPPLDVSKAEKSVSAASTATTSPSTMSAAAQAQPSIASLDNPLDSLITHESTDKQPEPDAGLQSTASQPAKEKPLSSSLDAFAQPVISPPPPAAAAVTENPLPQVDKPATLSGLPEHDIAAMPLPITPDNTPAAFAPAPSGTPSPEIKPTTVATINADQASTLSKKELEEKAKKLLKDSPPPKAKTKKKPLILGLLTLLLVVGAAGGGLLSYRMLENRSADTRSQAGFVGKVACVSPKGIEVPTGQTSPGQAGTLEYKPAGTDINDPNAYYDVSKGETVRFSVNVTNTKNETVNDQYHFVVSKVLESPKGTSVSEMSPLNEVTLEQNHRNDGDLQEGVHGSGNLPFSLAPKETKALVGSWTPRNDQCGLYQIDMGINDFANITCSQDRPGDRVIGAGFVRVVGCETQCGVACTSNSSCETVNSDYMCLQTKSASDWSDVTTNVDAAGSGALSCFNAFLNTQNAIQQHVVRNGQVWARNNGSGTWSNWENQTSNVNSVGSGAITGFSSYVTKAGHVRQHLVRGGEIWTRSNESGGFSNNWENQTSNVNSVGSGAVIGFNVYLKGNDYEEQFLVKGGELYKRDNKNNWSEWERVTASLVNVGSGAIACYSGSQTDAEGVQRLVRGGKLYQITGDWFAGVCRLASNPTSQACAPAPTLTELACSSLHITPASVKLGDTATFTCDSEPSAAKYEFRYRVGNGTYQALAVESSAPHTAKLMVTSAGAHVVECRACEDAGATKCTTWGRAK